MEHLQEYIDMAITSGMAMIYFSLGICFCMLVEGIGALIEFWKERRSKKDDRRKDK